MESPTGQADVLRSAEAVVARVTRDVQRTFGGVSDNSYLDTFARDAVNELWTDSVKVTTFIPVLAVRRVRDWVELRQVNGPSGIPADI